MSSTDVPPLPAYPDYTIDRQYWVEVDAKEYRKLHLLYNGKNRRTQQILRNDNPRGLTDHNRDQTPYCEIRGYFDKGVCSHIYVCVSADVNHPWLDHYVFRNRNYEDTRLASQRRKARPRIC